jgi:hypothetical protein
VDADVEGFGTRPSSGRPHSIRLDGEPVHSARYVARGFDVLLGVGIGAAAMYYLDPSAGSRRRARAREAIVGALGSALHMGGAKRGPTAASEPPVDI